MIAENIGTHMNQQIISDMRDKRLSDFPGEVFIMFGIIEAETCPISIVVVHIDFMAIKGCQLF